MHIDEIECIEKYLKNINYFLEYGSGGSTIYFSSYAKLYFSIEHDMEWYNKISLYTPGNVIYTFSPAPIINGKPCYKEYIDQVDRIHGVPFFDAVLIDGRERVACAKKILDRITEKTVVFIHDFFMPGREKYREVLKYYDIIDKIDYTPQTLVVLRKKV